MKKFTINTSIFSPFRLPKRSGGQVGGDAAGRGGLKKLILFLIFTFYLLPFSFSQEYGWTDISANMPALGGFTDVHFIGDEGWITGGSDQVFYTPDGGKAFVTQNLPENSGITSSIFMKSSQVGYVVTFLGNILKTTDGGTTWTTLHEPGGGFNSVHFPPNSETGYACGSNGTIWSFDDVSITDISPSGVNTNLKSICFPEDNSDGKVCGETTIARYMDNSWNNLQFYDNTLAYNSIFFIDNSTGWCVGINGTIILTVDGFSWVGQTSNTTITLNDVFFINSNEGWAVGYETLLHSIDGGISWNNEATSLTGKKILIAIYFTDANHGYVIGNGVVLKYGEHTGIGEETKTLQCNIFPNPAKDKLQIKCSDFKTENGTIEILSLYGKEILKREIVKGNENIELDLNNLKSAMYLCKISTDKKSMTKKLIIE